MHKQIQKAKADEGFTLIELLIVIVILGILAAIVVFSVGGITDRGNKSACQTNSSTIQTAAEAFRANNTTTPNAYPAKISDMVPNYLKSLPGTETSTAAVNYLAVTNNGATTYYISYNPANGIVVGLTTLPVAFPTTATVQACPA